MLRIVLDAVDSNINLYLCSPLGNKNTTPSPAGDGLHLGLVFLAHPNARVLQPETMLCHRGSHCCYCHLEISLKCPVFHSLGLAPLLSLLWNFPHLPKPRAVARSLKTLHCSYLSQQQVLSSALQNGCLWICLSFLRAEGHLTHVWFVRQAIMPFCCMNEIPLRYIGLGQSHSGESIARLEGAGVVSQWCSLTAYEFIKMVFLFNF